MNVNSPLDRYRIFVMVAETGSFTQAGNRLYLSQPAVSQAMKKLEEEVGSPLLIRGSRGVRVTPEGEVLWRHLRGAFDLIEAGERHVAAMQQLARGEIRIGASDNLCRHYLLPRLAQFHELHPEVHLQVTNRTSRETVELLRQGRVDFGVVNLPIEDDGLVVHTGPVLHDCFVAGERYRHLINRVLTPAELVRHPVMLLERGSVTRQRIDAYFASLQVSLDPEIELGSMDLLAAFARAGFGVAAVVREFFEDQLEARELFPITLHPALPPHRVGLIQKPDVPLSQAAAALFGDLVAVRF